MAKTAGNLIFDGFLIVALLVCALTAVLLIGWELICAVFDGARKARYRKA